MSGRRHTSVHLLGAVCGTVCSATGVAVQQRCNSDGWWFVASATVATHWGTHWGSTGKPAVAAAARAQPTADCTSRPLAPWNGFRRLRPCRPAGGFRNSARAHPVGWKGRLSHQKLSSCALARMIEPLYNATPSMSIWPIGPLPCRRPPYAESNVVRA